MHVDLAGHPGKPKICQTEGEVLEYFRALWSRPSALEKLSTGGHGTGNVRQWLKCHGDLSQKGRLGQAWHISHKG